ncbi:MAG TPA: phosphoribosylformylglycinamidine synthase subunit PurL [Candidatus Acidoferrales bacterium]|nr:phosphoribosylformylglycinamidine synthase subunit PurL [Candidatus Acidoferrales bacterium]
MPAMDTDLRVTEQTAAEHGLTLEEYARARQILGRDPTLTELGIFSVMWSEHCSYKSSRAHLKRLPTGGPQVIEGPGENAGVVDIGEGLCAVFKIESHNHPSFVEPFQGAATGVGGILRDIFTMGARPIAVLDSLRFGPIGEPAEAAPELVARNRRLVEGVIGGISFYGNCFGVPTVGGEIGFERCYSRNPLVNVLALGIARRDGLFLAQAHGAGNPVVYVGARTGRDGIHGASLLASAEFNEQSQEKRPNVQVGDPFMEKLLLEACLEAMAGGAVVAIQDMGAAGLTCSTAEMASRGQAGIEIDLGLVPRRESGMTPYEVMLSESQERMLLVARRGRESELIELFKKWGLDAVAIGQVTADGMLRVLEGGRVVAEIPARPLCEEGPVYARPAAPPPGSQAPLAEFALEGANLGAGLERVLASPAVASKRWVWEQYDTMVRTNTLLGPGGGDAAVLRVKGTRRALALATDGNGRWCKLDPYVGAMHAVAEAARNVASTGARPLAATNCLNFGNPEKPEVMWQFSRAVDGIAAACLALGTPITGGNVSFYNETLGEPIDPTPIVGILGLLEDAEAALGMRFRQEGDRIVLLDGDSAATAAAAGRATLAREFSSSEYAKTHLGVVAGAPPAIDLAAEKRLIDALVELAGSRLLRSAHDVSEGGLAVTLAEKGFGTGGLAAQVELEGSEPAEWAVFGERGARAVVSVDGRQLARLSEVAAKYNVKVLPLGRVARGEFRIAFNGREAVRAPAADLEDLWTNALARALAVSPPRSRMNG